MEEQYGVYFGNNPAGKAVISRQGLYYRISCRCRLSGDTVCRLEVACGDKQEDLGILVPMEDGFGLDTKLPAKRLGEGQMRFTVRPKYETSQRFVPICPEEPFAYISRLKDAYLVKKDGQLGILLGDQDDAASFGSPGA